MLSPELKLEYRGAQSKVSTRAQPSLWADVLHLSSAAEARTQVRARHIEIQEHELTLRIMHRTMAAFVHVLVSGGPNLDQSMFTPRIEQNDVAGLMRLRLAVFVHQPERAAMNHDDHEVIAGIAEKIVMQADRPATMNGKTIAMKNLCRQVELAGNLPAQAVHEPD